MSVTFNCDRATFYYGLFLEGFHGSEGDRNRKLWVSFHKWILWGFVAQRAGGKLFAEARPHILLLFGLG